MPVQLCCSAQTKSTQGMWHRVCNISCGCHMKQINCYSFWFHSLPFDLLMCVRSFIIKHAFQAVLLRNDGVDLRLEKIAMNIWWKGYGCLQFIYLRGKTDYLARLKEYPDELIQIMSKDLSRLAELLPNSRLVWFQNFSRLLYRYSSDIAL